MKMMMVIIIIIGDNFDSPDKIQPLASQSLSPTFERLEFTNLSRVPR